MNFLNIRTVFILIFIILTVAHIAYLHYKIRNLEQRVTKLRRGIMNILKVSQSNVYIPDEWLK